MTLNAQFILKGALRTARLTHVCCGLRSWPIDRAWLWTWAFTVSDKNVANELWFQSIWGLYEFSPGFTAEGATNRSWAAKLVIILSDIFEMCGHLEYVLLWKLLTAF